MKAYFFAKRAFDLFSSSLALILTSPIWLITIVGIKISDPGPVFYLAKRIGKDNKPFLMYKFRSMQVDEAADEKSLRADTNRIFRFGKFIRDTKIDELPQLLNIFFGMMSVVGPRPAAVDQVEITRAGKYAICSRAKPGLTSPSALYDYIYGDRIDDEAEYITKVLSTRLELDAWYVMQMNIKLDFKMIWYTVISIISTIVNRPPVKILHELQSYVLSNREVTI